MVFKFDKIKIIGAVFCVLIWSTAIPVLKIIYSELGLTSADFYERILLAGSRFFIAGIMLGIYMCFKDKKLFVLPKDIIGTVLVFCFVGTTLQYIAFYTGIMNTPAIKSVLLDSVKPLMVVLIVHFFSRDDKISVVKIVGLIIGFLGVIIANIDNMAEFEFSSSFMGEGMLIIASLMYSIAVVLGKNIMMRIKAMPLNAYQFLIGSSILLFIGLIGCKGYTLNFTFLAFVLLLYSALLSAVVFVVWYKLIDRYSASGITVYMFLLPVFGSIISSLLFESESITINVALSLVLLSVGIILVNKNEKNSDKISLKEE